MRRLARLALGLLLGLSLTGLAAAQPALPASIQTDAGASTHQVLVLLRMSPDHVRMGADYGGGYGDASARAARRRVAARLARQYGLQLVDGWPMPLLGVDCFIMTVPADRSPEDVALAISRQPGVESAQASHLYAAQAVTPAHGDPLFLAQPVARKWRLADLHELATGRGVKVAVIDSLIDQTHPDLVGQVQTAQNFVPDGRTAPELHGTAVAGIIAAREDNGVGIVGVAPQAKLMALRACWQQTAASTVCDSLSLAKALHFAVDHNAQVINLSLAGPPDPLLGRLIDVATARGEKVVAAFDRKLPHGGFPASHAGVVAVAEEAVAPLPDGVYSAPGRDVPTTEPGGRWSVVDGSSYAAAHVSGLLALVAEHRPLERQALALVRARPGGEIDACASLLRVSLRNDCACARHAGRPVARR
jgi:subtilisin family serine protease